MMIIVYLVTGLVVIVAGVFLVGRSLPEAHHAAVSAHFKQPVTHVWQVLTNYADYPAWRKIKSVTLLPAENGCQRWQEVSGWGDTVTFVEVEKQPGSRLVVRIADENLPFGGQWIYQLREQEGGTHLTITEEGQVYHPIFRFMSRYVLGHTKSIKQYQDALGSYLSGKA